MQPPSPAEIKQQLKTVENARVFSAQQMDYLRTIAEFPGLTAYGLSQQLHTTESQVRKLASAVREKLPLYYATKGLRDALYLEHSHRGYELNARRINLLAELTAEDRERFTHATRLREMRTAPKLKAALAIFDDLRERYPLFAPLCAMLADVYILLGVHCIVPPQEAFALAERYANQAIALDVNLWTAHAALAVVRVTQWRWEEARKLLDIIDALHPNGTIHYAHIAYCSPMRDLGGYIARLEHAEQSINLQHLTYQMKADLGLAYFFDGQYRRALTILQSLLQLNPTYHLLHIHTAIVHSCMGQNEAALTHLDIARGLEGGGYFTPGLRVWCLARTGQWQQALADLQGMKHMVNGDYLAMHQFACAYAGLGEEDAMLECLEESVNAHDVQATVLHAWPYYFAHHSHPRFRALFTKMGLPPPV